MDNESNRKYVKEWIRSWACKEGSLNDTQDILKWVKTIERNLQEKISECSIESSNFWFYDDYNGEIANRKRSFFSIKGIRRFDNNILISEQPIIFQPEIGYLGIIGKKINGVFNFLMQAKVEPGNINYVQISPTIQATKSNFTRVHGGRLPLYFEYFEHASKYNIIYDQIQSEQSSRFLKKRNRNIILVVEEDVPVFDNYKWMTLGQIKELMKYDNLINMDTRTVIAGLPFSGFALDQDDLTYIESEFRNVFFYNSIFKTENISELPQIYKSINDYKMFQNDRIVEIPLYELLNWNIDEFGITCKETADFEVRYYKIFIDGREVKEWKQPLFKALGHAVFGLIITNINDCMKILVKIKSEIGTFDRMELAPSIQWESTHKREQDDWVEAVFRRQLEKKENIILDVMLSEEGGRFYHEQNRNVVMFIEWDMLKSLPEGYIWVNYSTLNLLVQINNCLNIQLRNLLSTLEM